LDPARDEWTTYIKAPGTEETVVCDMEVTPVANGTSNGASPSPPPALIIPPVPKEVKFQVQEVIVDEATRKANGVRFEGSGSEEESAPPSPSCGGDN